MIRREKGEFEGTTDVFLIPPIVIRNALPYDLQLSFKDEEGMPHIDELKKGDE